MQLTKLLAYCVMVTATVIVLFRPADKWALSAEAIDSESQQKFGHSYGVGKAMEIDAA